MSIRSRWRFEGLEGLDGLEEALLGEVVVAKGEVGARWGVGCRELA